jgi:hypothetical protein
MREIRDLLAALDRMERGEIPARYVDADGNGFDFSADPPAVQAQRLGTLRRILMAKMAT